MKMDIVESDLKQLFMWIKNLQELCKSQQVLIEQHQDAIEQIYHDDELLEERIINIEHDLALILSVIKDRKKST